MAELWLRFIDEHGEARRVLVDRDIFTVGRHSENNLCIASGKLSREHIEIEHYADVFLVSDCGSSNGTTLNGQALTQSAPIKDGDRLILGGDVEIDVKITSNTTGFDNAGQSTGSNLTGEFAGRVYPASPAAAGTTGVSASSSSSSDGGSIPTVFYYIAPVFALVILIVVGGLFFVLRGKNGKDVAERNSDLIYQKDTPEDPPRNRKPKDPDKTPQPSPPGSTDNPVNNQTSDPIDSQTPVPVSSDIAKVDDNSKAFMRRIAQKDPDAYLEQAQINIVNEKIKSIKSSPNLVENLKAVKREASQFETLATSKNLKAQFLAAAALTGLAGERGNPVDKAKEMLPILSELKVRLDNKFADDNLLIIAAFDQGKDGKYGSLSGKIEGLAKTLTNVSPRQIRKIWFLKDKGKITGDEFDFAVRFLAIGTIMQNPKDFGVNTDAVTF